MYGYILIYECLYLLFFSGFGMLAVHYPDDEERGYAIGIALGGLALGALGKLTNITSKP